MTKNYQILDEKLISSPANSKHKLVDVTIKTPAGDTVVWQYIKTRDVVSVVALNRANQIYCVRQWRPAIKDYIWELPAGGINETNPTSEEVFENANRELQEEIGFKANKIELITKFHPTIHMTCLYYAVLATDLEQSTLPKDIGEDIEIGLFDIPKAYDLLIKQQTTSSLTLIGLTLIKQRLGL
jgi:ADP-ribose pyrophosphatase